jgi:hypothetical protein
VIWRLPKSLRQQSPALIGAILSSTHKRDSFVANSPVFPVSRGFCNSTHY